ncbi:MAG: phenylacetate--CoA ligase, partial [Proteobacteria bacterium]|nr:phenylacetate--CoA ligase [Pseudomonadota bacterium]
MKVRYFNKKIECASRKELEKTQLERLDSLIKRLYDKVPFYREKFDREGIKPNKIKTLRDLKNLPFTTKDDLRKNFPYGLFAEPLKKVVRIHASSGTTGVPTVVGYTKNDLKLWSELTARVLTSGGLSNNDIVQISFGYGLFTGAFGMHYGAERIGATVIPVSTGNTQRQISIIQNFGTTALICTPSYALQIYDTAKENGVDLKKTSLKLGFFGAEPWTETMRKEIEEKMGILATDNYGLSEVIGPGFSGECIFKNGLHIAEDHFIPEIINPQTGETLEPGQVGELVITTLTKEAIPIVRYRTRDLTKLNYEKCECGRTLVRMEKVKGRTDD